MGDIANVKLQVEKLSEQEQAELLAWLIERDHQSWDGQIEHDLNCGKLDRLIAEAKAKRASGEAREL